MDTIKKHLLDLVGKKVRVTNSSGFVIIEAYHGIDYNGVLSAVKEDFISIKMTNIHIRKDYNFLVPINQTRLHLY